MADIANVGIKVDTTDVQNAKKELGDLGKVGEKTEKSINDLGKTSQKTDKSIDELGKSSGTAARSINDIGTSVSKADSSAKSAATAFGAFRAVIATLGLVSVARDAMDMADSYTKLTAQLKLATKTISDYNQSLDNVKRISNTAQADISAVSTLYARLAQAMQDAGKSQAEIGRITETVSLGLKTSGASAAETASAMLQLSQAFGSGVLRGEEFNSVSESAPVLLRALAASMGVTYGELRTLAAEGKITGEVLSKAFSDPALLSKMREQAKEINTISGGFTNLKNSVLLFVGETNNLFGTSSMIGSFMDAISNKINVFAQRLAVLGMVFNNIKKSIGFGPDDAAPSSSGKITGLPTEKKAEEDFNLTYLNTQYQDLVENLQKGKISLKDFAKEVRNLYVDTGFLAKETKDKLSDYEKLFNDLGKLADQEKQRLALGRELTDAEKMRVSIMDDVANGVKKITPEQMKYINMQIDSIAATKEQIESNENHKKSVQELAKQITLESLQYQSRVINGRELTDAEKKLIDLRFAHEQGTRKMTEAEFELESTQIKQVGALQQLTAEQEKLTAERKRIAGIMAESKVSEMDHLQRLRMEADLVGRSAEQQAILRAQYESQARLKRVIGELARDGLNVHDPDIEAKEIAKFKAASDQRIQIIKNEELAKAKARMEAQVLVARRQPSPEEVGMVGAVAIADYSFKQFQGYAAQHQFRLDQIDEIARAQLDQIQAVKEAEEKADQAQFAMTDKYAQIQLAEVERVKEIQRLRATGEAHNIELADQYAKNLNNQGLMEAVGFSIAKQKYAVAAQELETLQKSVNIKDTEAMRLAESVKFEEILLGL